LHTHSKSGTDARLIFGWPALALIPGKPVALSLAGQVRDGASGNLCFSVAREDKHDRTVRALSAKTGVLLGETRVWAAIAPQTFQIMLDASGSSLAQAEGVALQVIKEGSGADEPLWVLANDARVPESWRPHFEAKLKTSNAVTALQRAERWLCSGDALQPFGWRSGCLLDALVALGTPEAEAAMDAQWAQFCDDSGQLCFDDWTNVCRAPERLGAEAGLPLIALLHRDPQHPVSQWAVDQWWSGLDGAGVYVDGQTTAAESAYMTAYPMMAIALQRKDEALRDLALQQLRGRIARLWDGQTLWLRHHAGGEPKRTFPNWCRGVAWHVLGFARTLRLLPVEERPSDLIDHLVMVLRWAIALRRPDGLWANTVDRPEIEPDSSGSAGIASAWAIASGEGWLPDIDTQEIKITLSALDARIDAGGRLQGCAQDNKAGPALQEGDYRVAHPAAVGLYVIAHRLFE